ncbi:MAG: amidohydrolase family protein [Fibrella sp.]|nr:amidohydrolase family protein [Armatimonadota bacterium]
MLLKPISIRAGAFTVATALSFSIAAPVLSAPDTYDGNAFAPAPNTFAITNARIVPVSGKSIERGTVVLRDGLIAAVGASVATPKDAQVIDGTGLTVYPALVDAYTNDGMPLSTEYTAPARGAFYPVTTVRAEIEAPSLLKPDTTIWANRRKNGFGSALIAPGVGLIAGTSAFVSLAPESPDTAALLIKSNVAMHASWDNPKPTGADDYPNSLMGEISAIRQALYDAVNADLSLNDYAKKPVGKERPVISAQISALVPVVKKQKPLVMHADSAIAIRRALKVAKEFGLTPVIEGGAEAGAIAGELKAAGASVLLTTALPEAPKLLDGEDDPTTLQGFRYRATVPRTAAKLAAAGVPFAFGTDGLKSLDDYRKNVRKMIAAGLPAEAATVAATQTGAKIFGADKQIGSLTPGSIGNVLVMDGDLWGAKTKIRYLFVDGKKTEVGEPATKSTTLPSLVTKAEPAPPKLTLEEAKKMLPAGVSVEQALKYLRESPKQAEQFLPKGVSVNDAIAALEGSGDGDAKPDDNSATKTPVKKDADDITAPPVVGTGLVPPLPPQVAKTFVLRGATVWTVAKEGVMPGTDVYVKDGKIAAIGANLSVPGGTTEIDAKGKHITPGMIDAHSHTAMDAVNEGSNIVTSECRIEDVIDPEDVNIYRQLAGGTTAANLLHGSANAIGGQNQIVKLRWGQDADGMVFAGAPKGIKFALGENPTQSNYQPTTQRYPYSRMGVERVIREAFTMARDYQNEWKAYKGGKRPLPPQRDLRMDALVEILEGKRVVHCHSYRQDEILAMIRVADDFGFKVGTFQHVMEGYKVADEMAKHGAGGSTFSDWWAYKFEVRDAIQYNGALMNERGVLTSFNSDSSELARRLNLEAAKAVHWGNVAPEEAIKFVTINPAKQLGIEKYVGSLEKGKDADIAVWSGDPLSSLTICEKTFVDGKLLFDRAADLAARPALEAEKKRLADAEKPKKSTPTPSPQPGTTPAPVATPKPPVATMLQGNGTGFIVVSQEPNFILSCIGPSIATTASVVFPASAANGFSGLPVLNAAPFVFGAAPAAPVTRQEESKPGTVTAIVGATVHPVSGADIPNGVVVMQGGKIVAVGANSAVVVPDGATVTDATGMHVYPGMFDADTQMGLREIDSMRETVDAREIGTFSPELRAAVSVNPDTDLLPEARANGILSVVTAPDGGTISGQGAVLSLNGWTWEELAIDPSVGMYIQFPRMGQRRFRETAHRCEETAGGHAEDNDPYLRSGAYVPGGTMDTRAMRFGLLPAVLGADEPDSKEKEDERVEKALKPLNDFLESAKRYKMAKDAGTLKHSDTKWEATLPVLAGEKPFFVRADREKDIKAAVNWAKKNGFRMVLVSGQESDKCADFLAREKIPVILGSVQNLPRTQDAAYDDAFTIPAKLAKAGVQFCLTAGETSNVRRLPWNAAMAASYGLDPETALKAITLAPAQITGHASHLGSIETGKDATLIITTGNLLEITSVVKAAFIRGESINLQTRQKQLYERYQSRPKK